MSDRGGNGDGKSNRLKGTGAARTEEQQRSKGIQDRQMYSQKLKIGGEAAGKNSEVADEGAAFELKVFDVIEVHNLKVTTRSGHDVYTGKLKVLEIKEKGTMTGLRGSVGGKEVTNVARPERYYNLQIGDTVMTCTASETAVRENLEKKR